MVTLYHDYGLQYKSNGLTRREAYFNAEQNAIVAKNAELYYRKMIQGGTATWNIRDTHMMDTLKRLMEFHGKQAKSIVWAHNTHVGDAKYTDMAEAKMVNIGQLVREHAEDEKAALVGFGTYQGTIIAAKEWGEKMQRMHVPPAVDGSWDSIIHEFSKGKNRLLLFEGDTEEGIARNMRRGQRAIGVVYNPEYERFGYIFDKFAISINSFKDKNIERGKEKMDTEEDINMAAEKIMKDTAVPKLDALNMLLGRYQSQKRLEEAVIVQRIIEKEESKPENYGQGLHQDM